MKGKRLATFLILSLSLSACRGVYEMNAFASLEIGAADTDISGMLRESRLDELTATLYESSTYEQLDAADAAEIEMFLSELLAEASDPRVRGAAAESLSALIVHTTPAGAAVQALTQGFSVLSAGGEVDPAFLLDVLIPAEATATESAFSGFIATVYELRDIHNEMNAALQDPRVELTSGGDAFQAAFVTYLITVTVNAIDPDSDGSADESREAKTAVLYSALTGGEGSFGVLEGALSGFAVETLLTDAADPDSGIDQILASSGFGPLIAGLVPELGPTADGG